MPIHHELRRILEQRETLSREEASVLMESILAGHASEVITETTASTHIISTSEKPPRLRRFCRAFRGVVIAITVTLRSLRCASKHFFRFG